MKPAAAAPAMLFAAFPRLGNSPPDVSNPWKKPEPGFPIFGKIAAGFPRIFTPDIAVALPPAT